VLSGGLADPAAIYVGRPVDLAGSAVTTADRQINSLLNGKSPN
jgi:hypothetical protein